MPIDKAVTMFDTAWLMKSLYVVFIYNFDIIMMNMFERLNIKATHAQTNTNLSNISVAYSHPDTAASETGPAVDGAVTETVTIFASLVDIFS